MKFARTTTLLLAAVLCGGQLHSQVVVLDEDFSSGVPPTGWIHENVNGNTSAGWVPDGTGRAWHEDYLGSTTINRLVSPVFSLVGMSQAFLHFEGETNFATYLANHPNSNGDGISNFEISTDGGVTWIVVWTDTSQADGTYGPSISLTNYLGQSSVQVGIYFYGTFAQEWWVDNVIVDDTPVAILDSWINPANQHPYYLLSETDWIAAQAMAITLGGSLVSISDAAENAWVKSHAGDLDCWIGINDIEVEGTSAWISGEPVLYTNWAAGDPSTGTLGQSEDYGLMYGNTGTWADFDNNRTARGMVEVSEPVLAYNNLVAGQITTISCAGLKIGTKVVFVFSVDGNGPTNTPYGILEVDPDMISPMFLSESGRFEFSSILPSNLSGRTLYGQAVAFNSDNSTELSNSMAEPIQ
jgi:hypothetical protein